jgi:hypothetical protein
LRARCALIIPGLGAQAALHHGSKDRCRIRLV